MNNKITTLEQAAENWIKNTSQHLSVKNGFIAGANLQKEQDEAKYKALLESHNELLKIHEENLKIVSFIKNNCEKINVNNWATYKLQIEYHIEQIERINQQS